MIEDLTINELEELFDKGEDPEELYDWDNARIAPPIFFDEGESLPIVIQVRKELVGKLDRLAEADGQTRSLYLSEAVGRMLSTA